MHAALSRPLTLAGAALALAAGHAAAQASVPVVPAAELLESTAPLLPTESPFALEQLRHGRVLDARVEARFNIKRLFHERGISYPAAEVFMRIFKRERALEVWVRPVGGETFALLKTYEICAMAGELGPKQRQGDAQTPEGFYSVDFFNPRSDFLLSLHLDYPNRRDRAVAPEGVDLGGDIFIHGGCNSEGCLALTDAGIREVYWLAVEARAVGQQRIPVHIFPARLGDEDLGSLQRAFQDEPELPAFWATLKPGYDFFEEHRKVPAIHVDARGVYRLGPAASPLGAPAGTPVDAAEKPGAARPLGAPAGKPVGAPAGGAAREPAGKAGTGPLGKPLGDPAPPVKPAGSPPPSGGSPPPV